ncbi:MAG: CBS domain-containing protein [Syntrophobacterales bacterium]|nr:CBS domain-containing protein [Syntrophobacterales bacterium]
MLVKDWMTKEVVWIRPEATIQDALKMMKHYSIRHLPVKEGDGTFVGWITDSDVRSVLIASMIEQLTVSDVMVREPYVASPEDHLEDVAFVMITKKIGGLPVLEGDQLVGVITVIDVLRAFMEMLGGLESAGRIDIVCRSNGDYDLAKIIDIVHNSGATVVSVCTFAGDSGSNESPPGNLYSLHVKGKNFSELLEKLKAQGVIVLSSQRPHPLKPAVKYSRSPYSRTIRDVVE